MKFVELEEIEGGKLSFNPERVELVSDHKGNAIVRTASGEGIEVKGTRAEVIAKLEDRVPSPHVLEIDDTLKDVGQLLGLLSRAMPTIWATSENDARVKEDADKWGAQACALHERLSAKYRGGIDEA